MFFISQKFRKIDEDFLLDDVSRLPSSLRLAQQRLTGLDPHALAHTGTKFETIRREDDDGRAMLEPAELVALLHLCVAGKDSRPARLRVQRAVDAMEPKTGNQNGRDRDDRQRLA